MLMNGLGIVKANFLTRERFLLIFQLPPIAPMPLRVGKDMAIGLEQGQLRISIRFTDALKRPVLSLNL
jgi:hypothetical protein